MTWKCSLEAKSMYLLDKEFSTKPIMVYIRPWWITWFCWTAATRA